MKKFYFLLVWLPFSFSGLHAQDEASTMVTSIFSNAFTSDTIYENLRYLTKHTKGRIAGSPAAAAAVEYTRQLMTDLHPDTVYLQPVQVSRWVRGEKEQARIISPVYGETPLAATALGLSVGTGNDGISGNIVEVKSFEELKVLGKSKIEGKIVFFNKPMDASGNSTFAGYAGTVFQRVHGASEAAKYGATGVLVRSMSTSVHPVPHTGVMHYTEGIKKIPAIAISTQGADILSRELKNDPALRVYFRITCKDMPEVTSYNVIGELRGSIYPNEIITVGGHLDAWDTGEGAHDDGAGCMHTIEVLRLFKALGIHPKRTIRFVMFMDEEINQRGGNKYAELAKKNHEHHYAALESDGGGFAPTGFGIGAKGKRLEKLIALRKYFEPYRIDDFVEGGHGVDIGPLEKNDPNTILIGLNPEDYRYFDIHHSAEDTFDKVNRRELQAGAASMAALIYLIDKFDL
jgi:hypothetical protein